MTDLSSLINKLKHLSYLFIVLVITLSPSAAFADASLDPAVNEPTTTLESEPSITTPPAPTTSSNDDAPAVPSCEPCTEPNTTPQTPDPAPDTTADTTEALNPTATTVAPETTATDSEPGLTALPAAAETSSLEEEQLPENTSTPVEDEPDIIQETAVNQVEVIQSTTGDITATKNRSLGDATTGDATAATNAVNIIQSQSSLSDDGKFLTFVTNIQGDVYGDILIDPAKLGTLANQSTDTEPIDVNILTNQTLNNNLTVSADTGNIALTDNRRVGNVKTGTADAVANVVNVLNSAIAAQQSFLGIINIYGNLNGDILLPEGFIDSLIANNTPSTTLSTDELENEALRSQFKAVQTINNNVGLSATTGSVTAEDTRRIGDITTGNANTNLTIFNLAGANVSAANSLLVFVNVLGEWVGFIINSPTGTTAAALGGGPGSFIPVQVDASTNSTINNNINVSASSGDVSLIRNRKVGNVQTGNATASANILNIINSQLSMSQWFGILFINVFGTWHGSFGVNTAYGGGPTVKATTTGSDLEQQTVQTNEVFQFVPTNEIAPAPRSINSNVRARTVSYASSRQTTAQAETNGASVLTASTTPQTDFSASNENGHGQQEPPLNTKQGSMMFALILVGVPLFGYGLYRAGIFSRLFA